MERFRLTKHVMERAYSRAISPDECFEAYKSGEVIADYPDDKPFPSELRVARIAGRVLHLVSAQDGDIVHIITVYEPDPALWSDDFKERRK